MVGSLQGFGDCYLENVGLEKLTILDSMLCEVWLRMWNDYIFFCPISVGYHSELCVLITLSAIIVFHPLKLCHIFLCAY